MKPKRRVELLEERSGPDPEAPVAVFEDTFAGRLYLLPSGRIVEEAPEPETPVKVWRGINPNRV